MLCVSCDPLCAVYWCLVYCTTLVGVSAAVRIGAVFESTLPRDSTEKTEQFICSDGLRVPHQVWGTAVEPEAHRPPRCTAVQLRVRLTVFITPLTKWLGTQST